MCIMWVRKNELKSVGTPVFRIYTLKFTAFITITLMICTCSDTMRQLYVYRNNEVTIG